MRGTVTFGQTTFAIQELERRATEALVAIGKLPSDNISSPFNKAFEEVQSGGQTTAAFLPQTFETEIKRWRTL